jgi:hypothetical protein
MVSSWQTFFNTEAGCEFEAERFIATVLDCVRSIQGDIMMQRGYVGIGNGKRRSGGRGGMYQIQPSTPSNTLLASSS